MSIQVLPPQLANQIAAGEVVERPASVVKELVENSLDAGATRIDIDIEKGGAKLIRIRDNGCGIDKDDLTLALARHATSKIRSLDDLEAIISLGFRGEALASISSVSRLTLTSRPASQREAWSAYAEGREMAVTVKPAAHPEGTTIEVLDLFYNTPARRKFMRTEKTEFTHIDEVVRRIALARFDVALSLSHNGKLVRQYRAATDDTQRERRLGAICGSAFLSHALLVEWQHGDLSLRGWVADPAGARAVTELQYCYVNGRMMRDRLINHAIRQAYQDKLGAEHQPAYVLYLEVDPHQVDVNVHPAKHEVRFHQSRLVHDFIYQGVVSVIQQSNEIALPLVAEDEPSAVTDIRWQPANRPSAGGNHFATPATGQRPEAPPARHQSGGQSAQEGYSQRQGALYQTLLQPAPTVAREPQPTVPAAEVTSSELPLQSHSLSFGRLLTVLSGVWALLEQAGTLYLLSLAAANRCLKQTQLDPASAALKAQPLLIPVRLKLEKAQRELVAHKQALLAQFGLDLSNDGQHVTLRAVPLPLRNQNLQILIPELIGYLASQSALTTAEIATWLADRTANEAQQWNQAQAIALLAEVERLCPQLVKSPPDELRQPIDIETAVNALKHD
ncbi:DNA mismatch repair protein MutL [Erwinia sp. OLTSP20]|uniref:DNA mismatch repair endonuclease MutL n=1 Tax=unclassified Erwinia TaxID=2622719 RepID=UPI000C1880E5|nr:MULTISPECIES: DNA mismatch repair endonuclease MutL [unclassified Erwinia]PIJ52074.1 DNA mismatch repair protein MutL [Erwinia sp. OAMSP11]PIJ75237.1 DNA mismatch repair protein MutL [Erwinia sp. OLSSP12]PIJ84444.1 DNA mismatch repair protein MutL [Erwinia sp. OLCASP19]PIJ87058.1 DNA mismatch repair protein MutL [Erwinia sp. OLMTSP26]PIJ88622.1 DNA mismatch repair protein MutL [Erwinia sp. OLMDSP33]